MDLGLTDKLALVTAPSGGLGFEIARSRAAEGARVIVNGRGAASVGTAIRRMTEQVPTAKLEPLAADNGTPEGCAATLEAFPDLDILVNNRRRCGTSRVPCSSSARG